MLWAELIIYILLIAFGFLIGAGTMAEYALNKHQNEVSKAYHLGYEMGMRAEEESVNMQKKKQ